MVQTPIDLVTGQATGLEAVGGRSPRWPGPSAPLLLGRARAGAGDPQAGAARWLSRPSPAAYRQIVRSRVAAQASYRTSFALDCSSQVCIVLVGVRRGVRRLPPGRRARRVRLRRGDADLRPVRPLPSGSPTWSSATSTGCRSTCAPATFDALLLRPLSRARPARHERLLAAPARPGGRPAWSCSWWRWSRSTSTGRRRGSCSPS